jgi:hypothetical protein
VVGKPVWGGVGVVLCSGWSLDIVGGLGMWFGRTEVVV